MNKLDERSRSIVSQSYWPSKQSQAWLRFACKQSREARAQRGCQKNQAIGINLSRCRLKGGTPNLRGAASRDGSRSGTVSDAPDTRMQTPFSFRYLRRPATRTPHGVQVVYRFSRRGQNG